MSLTNASYEQDKQYILGSTFKLHLEILREPKTLLSHNKWVKNNNWGFTQTTQLSLFEN